MKNASISIVIPTKNEESYIGKTIEQFRDYLEKYNLEIIISDANSKDGTANMVQALEAELGSQRVRLVQSDKNKTLPLAATSAPPPLPARSCFTWMPMCASRTSTVSSN
ncbi:MAG: glycosyltransferase [Lewinellaceae bacterium]|nr:glycosyltransferase [Lewinellaceae bacterium]